jgi:alkylhydroperoxidase family enzyme
LLCALAERLARDSQSVTAAEITLLQQGGFTDQAIHDAVQVIAYFSYINRIADALGVEAESWLDTPG